MQKDHRFRVYLPKWIEMFYCFVSKGIYTHFQHLEKSITLLGKMHIVDKLDDVGKSYNMSVAFWLEEQLYKDTFTEYVPDLFV
jgi:hypothetical protein